MNSSRLRIVLLGLISAMAILFFIIFLLGSSKLSSKSQKMVNLKLQSKVLDGQIVSLAQAKKQVEQYSYLKSVAAAVIPNDKDQAQAVLQITKLANKAGISIQSITFPSSTLGLAGTSSTAASGTTGTSATSASSSAIISQAKPVSGIKGLYSIQLTITPETGPQVPASRKVTYAKMLDFLDRIEHNQRTAQITQVTIQPQTTNTSSADFNFSLTTNIFIRP